MPLKLFWNAICPFAQRAWIMAVEKNVPVELVRIALDEDAPDWYKAINPRETVPAAQLPDGTVILESMYVAKYFDEAFEPKNALMTDDPITRARINAFIDGLGPFIGGCYQLLFSGAGEEAAAKERVTAAIGSLEATLVAASAGPFVLGQQFTMADVALVPFLDRFRYTLRAFRDFVLLENAPRLRAVLEASLLRHSVWSTSLSQAEYLKAYGGAERPLRIAPRWTVTARADSPALRSVGVLLEWIGGDAKTQVAILPEGSAERTTLRLPGGEEIIDTSTPPMTALEYLAEQFKALQPSSAVERSRGRLFADLARYIGSEDDGDAPSANAQMTTLLSGPYLLGDTPTLYDAAAVPLIAAALTKAATEKAVGPSLRALLDKARSNAAVTRFL